MTLFYKSDKNLPSFGGVARKAGRGGFAFMALWILTSCTAADRANILDPGSESYQAPAPMYCMVEGANHEQQCRARSAAFADCTAEYGRAFEEGTSQFSASTASLAQKNCLAKRPYLSCLIQIGSKSTCRAPADDPKTCAEFEAMGLGTVTPVLESGSGTTTNCAALLLL
jgi:hypothetical protein